MRIYNLNKIIGGFVSLCLLAIAFFEIAKAWGISETDSQGPSTMDEPHAIKLKVLRQFTTKGLTEGFAIRSSDGCIWTGNIDGFFRCLNPSLPDMLVWEKRLNGGVLRCLKIIGKSTETQKILVGTANGLYLFDSKGEEISFLDTGKADADLTETPLEYANSLLFVSSGGAVYQMEENIELLKLRRFDDGYLPGMLTCPPSLLRAKEEGLIYATESSAGYSGTDKSYIAFAPLKNRSPIIRKEIETELSTQVLDPWGKDLMCEVTFKPTISKPTPNREEAALLVTRGGKVIRVTLSAQKPTDILEKKSREDTAIAAKHNKDNTLQFNTLFDLKCTPKSSVVQVGSDRFTVIGIDSADKTAKTVLFSIEGQELGRNPFHQSDGTTLGSIPTCEPAVFEDKKGRTLSLVGFSDNSLRLIDMRTGAVLASLKTRKTVNHQPSQLNTSEFFVTEESGPLPEELTRHYLIKISGGDLLP